MDVVPVPDEDATEPALRLCLLGPLRVRRRNRDVPLGSSQQRSVLATLALQANRTVPRDSLIAALWGPDTPAYAVNIVQKCVSSLRRVLEPGRPPRSPSRVLGWNGAGYRLTLDPGCVDLEVFKSRVGAAGAALAVRDFAGASRGYHDALRLWRGPAFAGMSAPLLDAERARLDERRIGVLEERIAADLELGRDTDLVPELRALVTQYPLRERLRKLLMVALSRCGRQAEALAAFREAHRYLVTEVGVEPAAELRETHQRILADGDTVSGPVGAAPADRVPRPAQLPHAAPGFTGRAEQIRRLDELAGLAGADATPVAVITGTAGVGKTSLALHWAHRGSRRFPAGQLYVDLRGFHPHRGPREAGEVLRGFLEALGVPARRIPVHLEQQAALYRSLLAGRRMLVVLDNVHDTDQVTPLLPGSGGCMAVVTSRRRLSGLLTAGAYAVGVPLFTAEESRQMLARRLGHQRVVAEPEAVRQVVAASAHLPLALAVVAARAAVHPQFSLATFAEQLRQAHGGLDGFAAEDAHSDARTVLSWSYRSLSPAAARLFRLLGLHPGPDLTVPAAACLAGTSAAPVRELLTELCVTHLIEERTPGRYAFHDLLRAYAAERAQEPDAGSGTATVRMFDHYLHTARVADRALYPYRVDPHLAAADPGTAAVAATTDAGAAPMTAAEATAWFTAERANLLAVVGMAARSDRRAHVYGLAWSMSAFLNYQGHWHDWVTTMEAALSAARRLGDRIGQAHAHRLLNLACIQLDRLDMAGRHARSALRLFGELGDRAGSARIHLNLSRVLERQGRLEQALDEARRALALFRLGGDWAGEADALSWVGWYCGHLGRPDQALDYCTQSLAVHRTSGDWPGQADTWGGLGYAHHQLGHHTEAVDCHLRALSLWRELGDRYEIAATLARLGDSHRGAGDHGSTRRAWSQAAEIFEELGHPDAGRLRRLLTAIH